MRSHRVRAWALGPALLALGLASPALAISTDAAEEQAQANLRTVEAGITNVEAAAAQSRRHQASPAERIAAGDIFLRNKDYERAIQMFSQVVELHRQGKVKEAPKADALFLLGETYFQDKQYLSARRHYGELLDQAARSPYDAYAGRALSRLVDVALKTDNLEQLDQIVARLATLPAGDATGSLQYARAKALFAAGDVERAKQTLQGVPATSDYNHQAQYLMGVILTKQAAPVATVTEAEAKAEADAAATAAVPPPAAPVDPAARARYAAAIEQFRRVTRLPAETQAERHVADLAWMAIGRLLYESDNYLDAAEAYGHVDRTSPEFSTMLYELAWVYVRLGDYQRAQRALEVLSITAPETLRLADGSLLRADLMLRSGQFDNALTLYRSVHSRFDPIRDQVASFIKTTSDPAIYYDKLVQERLEGGKGTEELSPIVIEWAREEAEDSRAFAVIDDVSRSRDLVRRSNDLAKKLDGVLQSPARAKAFPELIGSLEKATGLQNRLANGWRTLASGMDDVARDNPGGELGRVRAQRRALMKQVAQLPIEDGDFARREASGERQWNRVSQQLQVLTLEVDKLRAIINGLHRVMQDGKQFGVTRDPESVERFRQEIAANRRDLETYQRRIEQLRTTIDMGRAQVGFGDQRYVNDDAYRRQFHELFSREAQLTATGGDDADAVEYARRIQPLLARMDTAKSRLDRFRSRLETQAMERADALRAKVQQEASLIAGYAEQLDALDQQARLVVGELAMHNFGLVRDKLKSIVLRADVGIVQHAWEVREEHRLRVNNLQRERAREEQNLNDELREVLDDAEDEL